MQKIIVRIGFGVGVAVYVIPILISLAITKIVGNSEERKQAMYNYIPKMTRLIAKTTNTTFEVRGIENVNSLNEKFMLVGNHQSLFDALISTTICKKRLVVTPKIELSKIPIASTVIKNSGMYFMDRDNPRAALKTIMKVSKEVSNGASTLMYPEGTRSEGELLEFKKGATRIVSKSKCKTIPITIHGSYDALEGRKSLKRKHIVLKINEPIDYIASRTEEELLDELKTIITNERSILIDEFKAKGLNQ